MQENVFGLARLLLLELYIIVCDLSFLQSFVHEGCQEFWGCLYGIAFSSNEKCVGFHARSMSKPTI